MSSLPTQGDLHWKAPGQRLGGRKGIRRKPGRRDGGPGEGSEEVWVRGGPVRFAPAGKAEGSSPGFRFFSFACVKILPRPGFLRNYLSREGEKKLLGVGGELRKAGKQQSCHHVA